MSAAAAARLYVLAGVNGAGKSSIGGAAFREQGGEYYNPDEAARRLLTANPALSQAEANSRAWHAGRALLEQAIAQRLDFAFETTLGASTIPRLLAQAAKDGIEVRVWYVGLASPALHISRVRARVALGGHAIPEDIIRRRFEHSRLNLIQLMPALTALRVYDNSAPADPASGKAPAPLLVLHMDRGRIMNPGELGKVPAWVKPIAAAGMKMELKR